MIQVIYSTPLKHAPKSYAKRNKSRVINLNSNTYH